MKALMHYVFTDNEESDPNLPMGILLNIVRVRLFIAIYVNEDHTFYACRALTHHMLQFRQADLWWLVETSY